MPLPTGPIPAQPSGAPGAGQPVAQPVQPCSGALPSALSKTCADAPATVTLPKNVNDAAKAAYTNSFPGGKSLEHGGTLVKDAGGNISVVGEGPGTSGTFQPSRAVAAGQQIIGTFHTHPYDASEGGYTGVSFSGADINYASYYKEPIYVDAGTKQFMIMPTSATPALANGVLTSEWDQKYSALLSAGNGPADASSQATNAIAQKYGMAYYEGKDGTLKKVSC